MDAATYYNASTLAERLAILRQMPANQGFSIGEARHLLSLGLSLDENYEILRVTQIHHPLAFEIFLLQGIPYWDPNLAALALRVMAKSCPGYLWFHVAALATSPLATQRIRYTILDNAPFIGGKQTIEQLLQDNSFLELSPTFHALLLERIVQFNLDPTRFTVLVDRYVEPFLKGEDAPSSRALLNALQLYCRLQKKKVQELLEGPQHNYSHTWEVLRLFWSDSQKVQPVYNLGNWPSKAYRQDLDKEAVVEALRTLLGQKQTLTAAQVWQLFAGCQTKVLEAALQSLEPGQAATAFTWLASLLPWPLPREISERTPRFPPLPAPVLLSLIQNQEKDTLQKNFAVDTLSMLKELSGYFSEVFASDEQAEFFDLAYHHGAAFSLPYRSENYWSVLCDAWRKPDEKKLAHMTTMARKTPALFRSCFIRTLGRFKGSDEATLKLLDYIRSENEHELREVITSFANIGTARALQELISSLTRPNIGYPLALYACQLLRGKNLTPVRQELSSALEDFLHRKHKSPIEHEIEEALLDLSMSIEKKVQGSPSPNSQDLMKGEIDDELTARIPSFSKLSAEVRRALRTAQFFHTQTQTAKADGIDLSPVIDMQYKALELLFRESFEDFCGKALNKGVLQRKLDILGYARPIPKAMDEFENYIANLPIIRDIPYFSKFKLRKLMRGICMYRPGKRFTLDGLKAFAIFFLCFSRQECTFGLSNSVPLPFENDQKLFAFCKDLHIFQDFRNRAAHEGFRPESRDSIHEIWQSTASIIAQVEQIKGKIRG